MQNKNNVKQSIDTVKSSKRFDKRKHSVQKEYAERVRNVNSAYKLDLKLESKNDPFKSSNEIKRTFYISDSNSPNQQK